MSPNIMNSHLPHFKYLREQLKLQTCVYLTGSPSVGKTTFMLETLKACKGVIYIFEKCSIVANPSKLYNDILKELFSNVEARVSKKMNLDKVIGAADFEELFQIYQQEALKKEHKRIFVVFDKIELFKNSHMMDAVVTLSNKEEINLIFISDEKYRDFLDAIKPDTARQKIKDRTLTIRLPEWRKSDIIDCICAIKPTKLEQLYKIYVHTIVETLYSTTTTNYVELKNLCQQRFEDFIEFYKTKLPNTSTYSDEDIDQITKISTKTRSASLVISYIDSLTMFKPPTGTCSFEVRDRKLNTSTSILVVAAYVAANTRPSDDKRNFIRFQKRKITRESRNTLPRGSKTFTMERLLQIYKGLKVLSTRTDKSIDDDQEVLRPFDDVQNSVLSDISILEESKIIKIVAGDGLHPYTRYKLTGLTSYEVVNRLAEQNGLELQLLHGIPTD